MTMAQDTARTVSTQDLRDNLADHVRDAEYGTPHVITRNGKPRALLVPITCAHCGAVIRVTASGTNWTDNDGSDTCQGSDLSHEPRTEQ